MVFAIVYATDFPDIAKNLFPSFSTLIAHLIATIIILLVLFRLAWKPFKTHLKTRQDYIRSFILKAEENARFTNNELTKANQILSKAQTDAKLILAQMQDQATQSAKLIVHTANTTASQITSQAQTDVELINEQNQAHVKQEVMKNALSIAQLILNKKFNPNEQEALINDLIIQDHLQNVSLKKRSH